MSGGFISRVVDGVKSCFGTLTPAAGDINSSGPVNLLQAATRATSDIQATDTTTSALSTVFSMASDSAYKCVQMLIALIIIFAVSYLGPAMQAGIVRFRIQRDSLVKSLLAELDDKNNIAAADAVTIHDLKTQLGDINAQHRIKMDQLKSDHEEATSHQESQLRNVNVKYQRDIDQAKSDHVDEVSAVSSDLRDERRTNVMNQSRITSLQSQLKAVRERDEKKSGPRKNVNLCVAMALKDQAQRFEEKHSSEVEQMKIAHAAALEVREGEIQRRHQAELAAAIVETEKRVKEEVKAELLTAKSVKSANRDLRSKVTAFEKNAAYHNKQLLVSQRSSKLRIDFVGAQREAEYNAEIKVLQTENDACRKKAVKVDEDLRACKASKNELKRQLAGKENDMVPKHVAEALKKKIKELEDLLRSCNRGCDGSCTASKARDAELSSMILANIQIYKEDIAARDQMISQNNTVYEKELTIRDGKTERYEQRVAELTAHTSILETENENLKKQVAMKDETQSRLTALHTTTVSQAPQPLPSPPSSTSPEPTPLITNVLPETVDDKPQSTSETPLISIPETVTLATETMTETMTPEETASDSPMKTTMTAETTTAEPTSTEAEAEATTMEISTEVTLADDPIATSPSPIFNQGPDRDAGLLPDAGVLPDVTPNDRSIDMDESMGMSPFPANPPNEALSSALPINFSDAIFPSDNEMAFDSAGTIQPSDNHVAFNLADATQQFLSLNQPDVVSDESAPRFEPTIEPVAFHYTQSLQTALADDQPSQVAVHHVDDTVGVMPIPAEIDTQKAWDDLDKVLAECAQTPTSTTPFEAPVQELSADPALLDQQLPSGVIDQSEPQISPRKVHALPSRRRRPENSDLFLVNDEAERDPLMPKPFVEQDLPLIVDIIQDESSAPDGKEPLPEPSTTSYPDPSSITSDQTPQFTTPYFSQTSVPNADFPSAPPYNLPGFGNIPPRPQDGPIFDDPAFFAQPTSPNAQREDPKAAKEVNNEESEESDDDEGQEFFDALPGIFSTPSHTNPINCSYKDGVPSPSHLSNQPPSHPSTPAKPPQGVDVLVKGKKRGVDVSDEDAGVDGHDSSPFPTQPSSSSAYAMGQRPPASTEPASAPNDMLTSGQSNGHVFTNATNEEMDRSLQEMGLDPDDFFLCDSSEPASAANDKLPAGVADEAGQGDDPDDFWDGDAVGEGDEFDAAGNGHGNDGEGREAGEDDALGDTDDDSLQR